MPRLAQLAFIGADAWVERFRFVKKRFGYLTSCTCLTIATGVAAIFINSRWVQSPSRTGASALAIQIAGWIWYFAALQTALTG